MSTHLLLAPSQGGAAQRTYLAPLLRLPPLHLADTGWRGEEGQWGDKHRQVIRLAGFLLIRSHATSFISFILKKVPHDAKFPLAMFSTFQSVCV